MVRAAHPTSKASSSSSSSKSARPHKRKTKPATDKRVAANRANARKSTGPRTAAGKARSRFNALRHGLCARVILLPGEDREEFEEFAHDLIADLEPVGPVQEMLAARVAGMAWALTRLPDTASELVEIGEGDRFGRWFNRRGLRDKYYAHFRDEARKQAGGALEYRYSRAGMEEIADAELLAAEEAGNPPPEDLSPAGILADAMSDNDAFEGLLKLEEHERRIWSAMLSTLCSLERRQKVIRDRERERERGNTKPREQAEREPAPRPAPKRAPEPALKRAVKALHPKPKPRTKPALRPRPRVADPVVQAPPAFAERDAAPPAHAPARNEPISAAPPSSQHVTPSDLAEPGPRAADSGDSCKDSPPG